MGSADTEDVDRDVTGEVALRNTIEEFGTLQSIFPFPYIEATEHCIITKFNPAAAQAFGISAERALGKNVTILMPKYRYPAKSWMFSKKTTRL